MAVTQGRVSIFLYIKVCISNFLNNLLYLLYQFILLLFYFSFFFFVCLMVLFISFL